LMLLMILFWSAQQSLWSLLPAAKCSKMRKCTKSST